MSSQRPARTRGGGYPRVTIEQGVGPATAGRPCTSCGQGIRPDSRFCDACGATVERA